MPRHQANRLKSASKSKFKTNSGPKRKPGGVASVTVDVENVVLPGILSRYSSLAAR
jgi:hypothetical protein